MDASIYNKIASKAFSGKLALFRLADNAVAVFSCFCSHWFWLLTEFISEIGEDLIWWR
jgi:hypothetical protein